MNWLFSLMPKRSNLENANFVNMFAVLFKFKVKEELRRQKRPGCVVIDFK